jgi:TPR repeat protein
MKFPTGIACFLASSMALACEPSVPLDGTTLTIASCNPSEERCVVANSAMADYASLPDNNPALLSIALQTSPWRMYDPEQRIVSANELAAMLRPSLGKAIKRVRLDGNWTATSPGAGRKSHAGQVSAALGGVPVDGRAGFLWIASDGGMRVTRQSFTGRRTQRYHVKPGGEVMLALVAGWAIDFEKELADAGEANGVLLAAVGWDVFGLCPERALQAFERADALGSAIGAYNAAVMRLERGKAGDRAAAIELLERAARRKDAKSAALLATLRARGR